MRLKWLEVKAFKAYDELTHLDFDDQINCIVGLNGSGKSTILEAITVLISEVSAKRNVEAKALLHKGARHQAVLGHVEVCFLLDGREVKLKKTFSLSGSGDAYFIDGRRSTKHNFVGFLTSAGFSRNNPYYVVGQGKVQDLALISDETRLKLLKDLSGIGIYEEKRNEALKRLEDHRTSLQSLDTGLIEERLKTLEGQKTAIKRRNQLRQKEDCFTLLVEQLRLFGKFIELPANHAQAVDTSGIRMDESETIEHSPPIGPTSLQEAKLCGALRDLAERKEKIEYQIDLVEEQGELIDAKRAEIGRREAEWTKCTEQIKKLDKEISGLRRKHLEIQCRMTELQKREERRNLNDIKLKTTLLPERNGLIARIHDLDSEIMSLQAQVEKSQLEFGASFNQYKSAKEREQHVRNVTIPMHQQVIIECQQEIASLLKKITAATAEMDRHAANCRMVETVNLSIKRLQRELPEVVKRTQEILSMDQPFDASAVEQEYSKIDRLLRHGVRRGYNCVLRSRNQSPSAFLLECHEAMTSWIRQDDNRHQVPEILGPLWSLITPVSRQLETAVSAALTLQLDALVVRDDSVASSLGKILKDSSTPGASLTVTPLLQICDKFDKAQKAMSVRGVALCQADQKLKAWTADIEAVPLVAALIPAHNPKSTKLDGLLRQVAGRWLLVRDAEVGNRLRSVSDCVCLDGTLITKKGTLTGGYRSPSMNIMATANNIRTVCEEGSGALNKAEKTELIARRDALQQHLDAELMTRQRIQISIQSTAAAREELDRLRALLRDAELRMTKNETSIATYEEFLNKKIGARAVTSDERKEEMKILERLSEQVSNAQRARKDVQAQIDDLDGSIAAVRRIIAQTDSPTITEDELIESELRVARQTALHETLSKRRDALYQSLDVLQEEIVQMEGELWKGGNDVGAVYEQLRGECDMFTAQMNHLSAQLEADRKQCAALVEATQQKLIDPSTRALYQELLQMPGLDYKRIEAEQRELRTELESLGALNNRAVEDLELHQEEYQTIVKQSEAICSSIEKLEKLIESLNQRRHTVLMQCFQTVNSTLQQIFKAVVPHGYAEMSIVLQPREERDEPARAAESPQTRRNSPPASGQLPSHIATGSATAFGDDAEHEAIGATLRASFTPATEPLSTMSLSGGQKTIVALCLLLAMQRYEPAPFYILDEVDAALDQRYRANVAALLKRSEQQYLSTSFRPEFVEVGSKHFVVTNSARVASVRECSLGEALELVRREEAS